MTISHSRMALIAGASRAAGLGADGPTGCLLKDGVAMTGAMR